MQRRVFYSFHYKPDAPRAAQVRNMGVVEGNRPATDNAWETVKRGGAAAIKRWIADQMRGKSCTVVLVGQETAGRKWIKHEIIESWKKGMGVVWIHVHGLKDLNRQISAKGRNPFLDIPYGDRGQTLFSIVKCYDPAGNNSARRYGWIREHLANIIEEAITIRHKR